MAMRGSREAPRGGAANRGYLLNRCCCLDVGERHHEEKIPKKTSMYRRVLSLLVLPEFKAITWLIWRAYQLFQGAKLN